MILGHGVELIEPKDHAVGLAMVQAFANRGDARVYAVDTFWQAGIASAHDVVRAVLDSMQIWDWYGYRLDVSLAQCLGAPDVRVHVVVVALNAALRGVAADAQLLRVLERVHTHASRLGKQFRTVFFTAPLASATPRI